MEEREKWGKKMREEKMGNKEMDEKIHRTTEVFLWIMRKGEAFFRYP